MATKQSASAPASDTGKKEAPSTEENTQAAPGAMELETFHADSRTGTTSADFDASTGKPLIREGRVAEDSVIDKKGAAVEEEPKKVKEEEGDEEEPKVTEGDEEEGGEQGAEEGEEAEEEDIEAQIDPGDWDPEDPEVAEKFAKRYWMKDEDGNDRLNINAFGPELQASIARGDETPDISKGGRAWLKDSLGLSDQAIDQQIAGSMALRAQYREKLFAPFGGEDGYNAHFEWAKENYTPAQKARFDAAIKPSADPALLEEQLDLLRVRAQRGGLKVPAKKVLRGTTAADNELPGRQYGPKGNRRPVSPKRSATGKTTPNTSGGVEPFQTLEEHRRAQDEAMASGDPKKMDAVRARLRASPKLWKPGA